MPDRKINQHDLLLTPRTGDFVLVDQSGIYYKVYLNDIINLQDASSGAVLNNQTGQFITQNDNRTVNFNNFSTRNLSVSGAEYLTGTLNIVGNQHLTGILYASKVIFGETGSHLAHGPLTNILGGERNSSSGKYSYIWN